MTKARRARIAILTGVLVTLIGIGLAWILTSPIGSVTPAGSGSASDGFYRIGEESAGLAIGQTAPELQGAGDAGPVTLTDLDGQTVSLVASRGRPVWVVFWASWCPPCQAETPDLERAFEVLRDTGLQLIAVDVQEPEDVVRRYVEQYGLTYTVALDTSGSVFREWQVFGLPTHYLIDRDGVIRDRSYGPMTLDQMLTRLAAITPE